jgi:peptide/nickel transport system permease protein
MSLGVRATVGAAGLAITGALTLGAAAIAPNRPSDQFSDRAYAPPMRVHMRDRSGWHAPFVYRQALVERSLSQYREDTTTRVPLWASARPEGSGPVLLLGGDALGRDLFSRLLYGAQLSLGVTLIGACGAILLGTVLGGFAGAAGGRTDTTLMLLADFVLVLPGVYLVLVLRSYLARVFGPALPASHVFWLMSGLFAVAGWPHVARGVRAIVATERTRDYAEAARAAGAGRVRVLRHLLPAARGFLGVELVLLVPALLVAEATISYLGLGFPEPTPSWGTMLLDAANVSGMTAAPWTLAPAAALFFVVLCVQLLGGARGAARAALYEVPTKIRT